MENKIKAAAVQSHSKSKAFAKRVSYNKACPNGFVYDRGAVPVSTNLFRLLKDTGHSTA